MATSQIPEYGDRDESPSQAVDRDAGTSTLRHRTVAPAPRDPSVFAAQKSSATGATSGAGSAVISTSNVDGQSSRPRDRDRNRELEQAYNRGVKALGRSRDQKKRKLSKRGEELRDLLVEADTMYDSQDGKLLINNSPLAKRILAEHVLKACAGRGTKIDSAVRQEDGTLRVFPGLATLVAVSPKVEGFRPSDENNPDPEVYCEGIKPLGAKFYNPIIKLIIRSYVRYYKVYVEMAKVESSDDPAKVRDFEDMWKYLQDRCPELLMWKFSHSGDRASKQARETALDNHPLNRMLQFLEKTCARTTKITLHVREHGKSLNERMICHTFDCLVREEFEGGDTQAADAFDPDPVLYAIVKATRAMILQGLKQCTDAGRLRAVEYFTKTVGIACFKMLSDSEHFNVHFPNEPQPATDGEMVEKFSSGLALVPDAKTFPPMDRFSVRTMLPESLDDLKDVMDAQDIDKNKKEMSDLTVTFSEMLCEVSARKYVIKKGKKFDSRICSKAIDALEDPSRTSPEHVDVSYRYQLHRFALTFLSKYLQVPSLAVLIATHESSLKAVHALALSFRGILRSGIPQNVDHVLEAHKGPMTLMYRTKTIPKLIGLMGVKKFPSGPGGENETGDETASVRCNQFDREILCLNYDYQEHLKNMMFISPSQRKELAPDSVSNCQGCDSDESDYERPQIASGVSTAGQVLDDDIEAEMSEMEDGF